MLMSRMHTESRILSEPAGLMDGHIEKRLEGKKTACGESTHEKEAMAKMHGRTKFLDTTP